MRDIKFKVWDKDNGCWFQPIYKAYAREIEELLLTPEGELILRRYDRMEHESLFPNRFEKVWYTGLKDKNEREIYEGDIIQFEFTENSCWGEPGIYTGHIRFDKGIFEIVHHRDPIRRYPDGTWTRLNEAEDMKSFMRWADEVKVIGNIYENKDLLATT